MAGTSVEWGAWSDDRHCPQRTTPYVVRQLERPARHARAPARPDTGPRPRHRDAKE
ncbi:hypothetical protein [Streptomyces xylophagus]|uniref:hypothetical protein n=1 Tax=Streptomyces xylophagus TaxID=285514 RepID=UPI000A7AE91C|nr:hypothetical protein [Streptomyces xylophagus]